MIPKLDEIIIHYPEFTGVHPACVAVPMIDDDSFDELVKSISEYGLEEPITRLADGRLIDGRTRLLACYVANQDIRVTDLPDILDPWQFVAVKNIQRRQLDTKQRAIFGEAWREHEKQAAKERQLSVGGKGNSRANGGGNISTTIDNTGKARDKIGERVGVSGKSIDKVAVVKEYAPEKLKDESTLEQAYREANKRKKEQQAAPAEKPLPIASAPATTTIITAKGVESTIALPKKVVFNQTNDSVDWASWTWNPVTGCEHGCRFCYAREIAHSHRMADYYPNKFEPTYHAYRLAAPASMPKPAPNAGRDGRVFVCSMADLFGKWVPEHWIRSVFESCLQAPEWEYLFLTKWPARYSRMPLLPKAWYGSSVVQQSDVARVEKAMQAFETDCVKWISLEPMLEAIRFSDLSWCDLVVIGSQTSTNQPDGFVAEFSPKFDWIVDVVNQCREAGVPYYLKANLGLDRPGMDLPKMEPRRR